MLHHYSVAEGTACVKGRRIVFVGDSTVRQLFDGLARTLEPALEPAPAERHSDRALVVGGARLDFIWDPYLNTSRTAGLLAGDYVNTAGSRPPSMLIVGGGLWHLRNLEESLGRKQWTEAMDRIWDSANSDQFPVADEVIVVPIERALSSLLSPDRKAVLRSAEIDSMNEELVARPQHRVAIASVFNEMIVGAESQTEDGLHFSPAILKVQADILLNLRCNSASIRKFPFDKTCCFQYPAPNYVQALLLILLLLWAPLAMHYYSSSQYTNSQ